MKRIYSIVVITSFLAAFTSCQKENTQMSSQQDTKLVNATLTANISETTKVTYSEALNHNLHQEWNVGDKILAFDDSKTNYVLTVTEVNNGVATLQGTIPANCNLHLIYTDGTDNELENLMDGSLEVSFSSQSGELESLEAIMLSDGSVSDGYGNFSFYNACSIIGVTKMKGIPSGTEISEFVIRGSNLISATISLSGNRLVLSNMVEDNSFIWLYPLDSESQKIVVGEDGVLSSPIYITIPAGDYNYAQLSAILLLSTDGNIYEHYLSPSSYFKEYVPSGYYIRVDGQLFGHKETIDGYECIQLWENGPYWALENVGAGSEENPGYYFSWGNTTGYTPENKTPYGDLPYFLEGYSCKWKSSVDGSYLSGGFSETNYINTKGSELTGNIPANKDYDAANKYMGGDWRMPTAEEFSELIQKCEIEIVYRDPEQRIAEYGDQYLGYRIYGKSGLSIFLPAAGFGYGGTIRPSDFYLSSTQIDGLAIALFYDQLFTSLPKYTGFQIRAVHNPKVESDGHLNDYTGTALD